ncbi:hypothetical protein ElyMa_005853100 [Elysia marginata]|uniref:Uncharacterized protein n=1 Tax=Elysia marginata TaxID=1093978 RepID=A0AAV4FZ84_9GAST|nr:hypothetical protein ElyMa_005853100 [Elysia marginata]
MTALLKTDHVMWPCEGFDGEDSTLRLIMCPRHSYSLCGGLSNRKCIAEKTPRALTPQVLLTKQSTCGQPCKTNCFHRRLHVISGGGWCFF